MVSLVGSSLLHVVSGKGDPLSPYQFLIVREVLSLLISRACDERLILGVQLNPYEHVISHIFFADDTLFFLKVEVENCQNLVKLIQ